MLPFESNPSPDALTYVLPPSIVNSDEAFIPSSLHNTFISPPLIVIILPSIPSYDLITLMVPSDIVKNFVACSPSSVELNLYVKKHIISLSYQLSL